MSKNRTNTNSELQNQELRTLSSVNQLGDMKCLMETNTFKIAIIVVSVSLFFLI